MKYKNLTDQLQTVPGAGEFQPGETKESPIEIFNANFELVEGTQTVETPVPTVVKAVETNTPVPQPQPQPTVIANGQGGGDVTGGTN